MTPPRSRYEVQIHIGASNKKAVISALAAIVFNLEAYKVEDEEIDLVSGGWDSGYSVTGRVDTNITGDSYRDALKAYMAEPTRHVEQVTMNEPTPKIPYAVIFHTDGTTSYASAFERDGMYVLERILLLDTDTEIGIKLRYQAEVVTLTAESEEAK